MATKTALVILLILALARPAEAATVVVWWNPSPEVDVVKYRVYRSQSSPCTTNSTFRGEVAAPNTTFVEPIEQTQYFCITAVDDIGQESLVSATATATYTPTLPSGECRP